MKIKKHIKIVVVACFIVIFSISALIIYYNRLSETDFPLELNLDKNVYDVGEEVSFTATIINKSGKDVNMSSNGEQPWVILHNVNDNTTHAEKAVKVDQVFKANEKITRVFEYEDLEAGTYILDARYRIVIDNVVIQKKIDDIFIEVR